MQHIDERELLDTNWYLSFRGFLFHERLDMIMSNPSVIGVTRFGPWIIRA